MKVVYSYIPHNTVPGEERYLPKISAYTCMLSVLQSRKFYDKVELYTNEQQGKFFKRLGIPFTRIDTEVLKDEYANCPSIPKIKTYEAQTEPFIHLDLDTILFRPVPVPKNRPLIFAHNDFGRGTNFSSFNATHTSYTGPLAEAHKEGIVKQDYIDNYDQKEIPNMNTVVVNDYELFAKASTNALASYFRMKDILDKDYMRFCLPEQGFIHLELLELSEIYKSMVAANQHVYSTKNFTHLDIAEGDSFPRRLESNVHYYDDIVFNNVEDILNVGDYNFGGILHLIGSIKQDIYIRMLVIHLIVTKFGLEYAVNISKCFGTTLDESEQLYEKYTEYKFNNLL